MKRGRGLVELELFNEMLKIPGTKKVLLNSVTNHVIHPKNGKLCAEIHESNWVEVKNMVKSFKKLKKEGQV